MSRALGAGHGHRYPRPVANVPPCRRKHLDRTRVGALAHGRQVTDHAAGPVGKSQKDCPVQLLHNFTEPAGNLKDHYLTDATCSDPSQSCDWTADRLACQLGPDVFRGSGREEDDMVVEVGGKVVQTARLLRHDNLDSVVPG